jgi:peptidyl-dipeptidase A
MYQHLNRRAALLLALLVMASSLAFAQGTPVAEPAKSVGQGAAQARQPQAAPTAAEAEKFITDAEARLKELGVLAAHAAWAQATYIIDDTEIISAKIQEEYANATRELAIAARRFDGMQLPPATARKFMLLKLALTAPPPADPQEAAEITRLNVGMESDYGKGKVCLPGISGALKPEEAQKAEKGGTAPQSTEQPTTPETATVTSKPDDCVQINEITRIMAESRDPKLLQEVWVGWHKVGAPMRDRYSRFVELSNKGARELGFKDTGTMWRSNYDMPPDDFAKEVERLWRQVQPLYIQLHAYVRSQLNKKYGAQVVPADGMIPGHLLGNLWAQEWGHVYDAVAPATGAKTGYDLTQLLKAKQVDELEMVRYGERFFTSLGLQKLPETFWQRSLFKKPSDRDVVCHASAWNVDTQDDVRLKMCILINDEDFVTVHHELGHNYYQLAYKNQPLLFQGSANDGFHEALGDAIALSTTPEYLKQVGLLEQVPPPESDLPLLLRDAMDKIAFLPFGVLIDQWRWKVFSGEVTPANYNQAWWQLRNQYQGISAPVPRSEQDFDPGAKYHVPGNTPYTRYFLARILQFQFHRALCKEAGFQGPLHRCSIYGNKAAGAKLANMMQMGMSRPWPDALEALTGQREIDATAIIDYFEPLQKWLEEQNRASGAKLGWDEQSRAVAAQMMKTGAGKAAPAKAAPAKAKKK